MEIIETIDKKTLEKIFRLRYDAWQTRVELDTHYHDKRFTDELDAEGNHFSLFEGLELMGSARVNISFELSNLPYGHYIKNYVQNFQKPFAMMSRLVVAPKARGKGYSNLLDAKRLEFLKKKNKGTALVVTSSFFRIEKLKRRGFQLASKVGEIDTFPGGKSTLLYLSLDRNNE